MKAITEKVELLQTSHTEMKSEASSSWASVTESLVQMKTALSSSDLSTELKATMVGQCAFGRITNDTPLDMVLFTSHTPVFDTTRPTFDTTGSLCLLRCKLTLGTLG